jgi:hypothetical protein
MWFSSLAEWRVRPAQNCHYIRRRADPWLISETFNAINRNVYEGLAVRWPSFQRLFQTPFAPGSANPRHRQFRINICITSDVLDIHNNMFTMVFVAKSN